MLALVKGQPATVIMTDFYFTYPNSFKLMIPEADVYSIVTANGMRSIQDRILAYTETMIIVDRKKPDFKTIKALSLYDRQGREEHRLLSELAGRTQVGIPAEADIPHYAYKYRYALAQDGRSYVAPFRDAYLVYVFSPAGELEKILGRQYQSRMRSDREKFLAGYSGSHGGTSFQMEAENIEADILNLYLIGEELLIRTSRSEYQLPPGVYSRLDLFQNSRYQAKIEILGQGNARRDQLIFLSRSLLVIVRGNLDAMQYGVESFLDDYQSDPVQVSLYRILRP